jgi:hypothetical protein
MIVAATFITACVIPHLWHVIPGGIYHRQGGEHLNPYVFDDIKTIADHRHRSAHRWGARCISPMNFPLSTATGFSWPTSTEHALLTDILEPRGSGFVGRHGNDASSPTTRSGLASYRDRTRWCGLRARLA